MAASVDEDATSELEEEKRKVKQLLGRINENSSPKATIKSGKYTIHYLIDNGIVYVLLISLGISEKVVFLYLEDLAREFWTSYGSEALRGNKPYAYVGFDNYIQKTMKVYLTDSKSSDNLQRLHNELKDVTNIMEKNIEDLLYRGDSLDKMQDLSANLRAESKKYKNHAKRINFEAMLRQYAPVAGISLMFVFMIWWIFLR